MTASAQTDIMIAARPSKKIHFDTHLDCPWGMEIWDLQEHENEIVAIPMVSQSPSLDSDIESPRRNTTTTTTFKFNGSRRIDRLPLANHSSNAIAKIRRTKKIRWNIRLPQGSNSS